MTHINICTPIIARKTVKGDVIMEKLDDKLQVKGVLSQGYGIIPKMLMKDDDLTIEAKAIYAYIASYAGAGSTAFPGVSLICHDLNISENRFHKHKKVLIKKGYIYIDKIRGEGGQFDKNLYTINSVLVPQVPQDEVLPTRQNEGTVKQSPTRQNPCMDKPSMDNPCMDNPCMENEVTINNSSNNNSSNINSDNKQQQQQPHEREDESQTPKSEIKNTNFVTAWEENGFGLIPPTTILKLDAWVQDFDGNEALIVKAIELASFQNVRKYSYLNSILKNWYDLGIRSLEQVEANELKRKQDFESKKASKTFTSSFGKKPKVEIEPNWMKEQQEQPKEEKLMDEATREAYRKRLARYRKGTEQDQTR